MQRTLITIAICTLIAGIAQAQNVKVSPIGVNVNPNSGTTVFLTYGQVGGKLRPAEATWCGELIPATPDLGLKCDPSTIFGSLPARYDLSRPSGNLGFTDVMSIPPSVARRAYQAAVDGVDSRFLLRSPFCQHRRRTGRVRHRHLSSGERRSTHSVRFDGCGAVV